MMVEAQMVDGWEGKPVESAVAASAAWVAAVALVALEALTDWRMEALVVDSCTISLASKPRITEGLAPFCKAKA